MTDYWTIRRRNLWVPVPSKLLNKNSCRREPVCWALNNLSPMQTSISDDENTIEGIENDNEVEGIPTVQKQEMPFLV